MTPEQLIARYFRGSLTAYELVVDSILLLGTVEPSAVLGYLPLRVLPQLRAFIDIYVPGKMLTNWGEVPTEVQVMAAKQWLHELLDSPNRWPDPKPLPG